MKRIKQDLINSIELYIIYAICFLVMASMLLFSGCASKAKVDTTIPFIVETEPPLVVRKAPKITLKGDKINPSMTKEIVKAVNSACVNNGFEGVESVILNYISILDVVEVDYKCLKE